MLEDDKRFELDLRNLTQLQEAYEKTVELRYQLAIIIIPTIIGLWGFIGVISTSALLKDEQPLIFSFVYIGIFVTIFLIYSWRRRVHDLLEEEIKMRDNQILLEKNGLCLGQRTPYTDEIKKLLDKLDEKIENELDPVGGKKFPQFITKFKDRRERCKFYWKNKYKLTNSGLQSIDTWSQGFVVIFLIFGLTLPFFFQFIFSKLDAAKLTQIDIFSRFFYTLIISFFIFWIIKIQELKQKVTFYESDIIDFCRNSTVKPKGYFIVIFESLIQKKYFPDDENEEDICRDMAVCSCFDPRTREL